MGVISLIFWLEVEMFGLFFALGPQLYNLSFTEQARLSGECAFHFNGPECNEVVVMNKELHGNAKITVKNEILIHCNIHFFSFLWWKGKFIKIFHEWRKFTQPYALKSLSSASLQWICWLRCNTKYYITLELWGWTLTYISKMQ